jgi:pimeloyl-ACP methyl ester carboxylesterase
MLITAQVFPVLIGLAYAYDRPRLYRLNANGVKIAYFVEGEGEPVVLIHGWLSSAAINWVLPGTSALLAKDCQVIALDVRGHGLSDKPTNEDAYGVELVEDIVRLLDHLKIKKAHIVGYSMGGVIAGNFIAKHPDRVLSGTLGGMGWLQVGSVAQFGLERIGRNDPNDRAHAIYGRSLARLALTEEELQSIRVPMFVLVGENDNLIKKLYIEPLQKRAQGLAGGRDRRGEPYHLHPQAAIPEGNRGMAREEHKVAIAAADLIA